MTRLTYAHLVALVDGDADFIDRLYDEGLIEPRTDDRVLVDVDRVLVARTLWRELEIEWPGIEVILRLRDELLAARRRIGELERALDEAAPPEGAR